MEDLRKVSDKTKLQMAVGHNKRKNEILYLAMLKQSGFKPIKKQK